MGALRSRSLVLALSGVVSACSGMDIEDFQGKSPQLVLEEYFQGESRAYGIFEDRFGTLRRQFVVDVTGTWDGDTLTLEEDFLYDDGERDRRVWRFTKQSDTTYIGRADDVDGDVEATVSGNAMTMSYRVDLPVGDSTWNVRFNDWMFLQEDGVLINRARVTRFGIEIGEATIVFLPRGAQD